MRGKRFLAVLGLMALLFTLGLVLAACNDNGGTQATPTPDADADHEADHEADEAGPVEVVLDEWTITDEKTGAATLTVHAGEVTFEVHNEGAAPHELVIIKTDTAPGDLPSNGQVDEAAAGEEIGEIDEFPGGGTKVDTFTLTPGKYALICNIPGHYQQGMFAKLTVEQ